MSKSLASGLFAAAVLLLLSLSPTLSHAQDSDSISGYTSAESEAHGKKGRSVGGHNFSEFRTLAWPFISTRVESLTALGAAEFTKSPRNLSVDFKGKFSTFREEFLLGLALGDRIGLEFFGGGDVIGGVDRIGALVVGVSTGTMGGGAIALKLFEGDRLYVSIRALGSATHFEGLSPVRVLDAIQQDEDGNISIEDISLSKARPAFDGEVFTGAGELAAALGLSPALGLQGSVSVGWRKIDITSVTTDREASLEGGVGLSYDLSRVGVELLAGARAEWQFSGDKSDDILLSAVLPSGDFRVEPEIGVFYSKREDLELGVSVVGSLGSDDKRAETGIRLGYFW